MFYPCSHVLFLPEFPASSMAFQNYFSTMTFLSMVGISFFPYFVCHLLLPSLLNMSLKLPVYASTISCHALAGYQSSNLNYTRGIHCRFSSIRIHFKSYISTCSHWPQYFQYSILDYLQLLFSQSFQLYAVSTPSDQVNHYTADLFASNTEAFLWSYLCTISGSQPELELTSDWSRYVSSQL